MADVTEPEELAALVVFLASEQAASYITGTTIQVDGGYVRACREIRMLQRGSKQSFLTDTDSWLIL